MSGPTVPRDALFRGVRDGANRLPGMIRKEIDYLEPDRDRCRDHGM
jgi:hypothetical protein